MQSSHSCCRVASTSGSSSPRRLLHRVRSLASRAVAWSSSAAAEGAMFGEFAQHDGQVGTRAAPGPRRSCLLGCTPVARRPRKATWRRVGWPATVADAFRVAGRMAPQYVTVERGDRGVAVVTMTRRARPRLAARATGALSLFVCWWRSQGAGELVKPGPLVATGRYVTPAAPLCEAEAVGQRWALHMLASSLTKVLGPMWRAAALDELEKDTSVRGIIIASGVKKDIFTAGCAAPCGAG